MASHKITDKIKAAQDAQRPYFSLEFFPPVTEQGMTNLVERVQRMSADLAPAWISVTWGAGGSTQSRSLLLAQQAQELAGCSACLHLTCTNMEKQKLDETLQQAKELGIRNILALRGDPPRGEEYWVAADERFQHASDLVSYIRKEYGDTFCIGVAGYPEGHSDAIEKANEIRFLKQKVDAGADFVVTQLFYNVDIYLDWYKQCRAQGIHVPIIPGIMPIQSYQSFRRMVKLCKSNVPQHVLDALEPIQTDDVAVKDYGVQLAVDIMQTLLANGINGFHMCTLNLEKSVRRIVTSLGWAVTENKDERSTDKIKTSPAIKAVGLPRKDTGLNDEHPNGRFGDVNSPADDEDADLTLVELKQFYSLEKR